MAFDPVLLLGGRLTFSALAFLIFMVVTKKLNLSYLLPFFTRKKKAPNTFGYLIGSALCGFVFYNLLVNYSLFYISAGILSTLVNTVPLISIFLGYWFFKERITWLVLVGTVIAFIGIWQITTSYQSEQAPIEIEIEIGVETSRELGMKDIVDENEVAQKTSTESTHPNPVVGIAMALLSAWFLGFYFILQKKVMRVVTPLESTGYAITLAAVISVGLLVIIKNERLGEWLDLFLAKPYLILVLMYLGAVPGFLGFLLWNMVLHRSPISSINNLLFLVPIVAFFSEVIFLSRTFLLREFILIVMVIGGVFISTQAGKILSQKDY